jgi:hypothetical protein
MDLDKLSTRYHIKPALQCIVEGIGSRCPSLSLRDLRVCVF